MSDFTIEQLEALKEGATPGPWEAKEDHGGLNLFSPTGRLLRSDSCGDVSGEEDDVDLMAAAPALVDSLIAEKQAHAKLRAEVEKLRDRKCSLSKTQYQTARDLKNGVFDETFGTMPEAHTVEAWEMGARSSQRTATALTRILEADDG